VRKASSGSFAEGKPTGLIPDEGGEDVTFSQRERGGCAQGFLTSAKEDAADDLAATVERGDLFLCDAREEHPAIGLKVTFFESVRAGVGSRGG
jgi:hypothetical protein